MAKVTATNVIIKERKRLMLFGLPFTFTTYTLTDKILLVRQGFLNTVEDEIRLHRVIDLTVKRSLWQRIIGCGTLIVNSNDASTPILEIKNIRHVDEFRAFLSDNVDKERRRNGVRSAEMIGTDAGDVDRNGDGVPDAGYPYMTDSAHFGN